MPAVATHITHAHPLSFFPALHARTKSFDFSNYFMTWHARKCESRKTTLDRVSIGMTNATGLDTNSNLPKGRLDNCSLNDFQLARFCYLHRFIGSIHRCRFSFVFCSLHCARPPDYL